MSRSKCISLLLLIVLVSFLPVLSANFVNWDDDAHILKNPLVLHFNISEIPQIFTTANSANKTYLPLTTLTWATEYALFGKNPLVFHLDNLLLHMGVVVLVFYLAQEFGLSVLGAFACALIFAVHPSRVENVAWVTARKDLLYGLFYLLAIFFYIKYLNKLSLAGKEKWIPYALALVCGLLSILSKAMALSLPFVLLLIDWMKGRRFNSLMLLDKIPFIAIIEPLAWVTYSQNSREMLVNFPDGFLVWFWSAAFYIQKFFWPGVMSPVYALPEPINLNNSAYLWSLIVIALTAIVLWRYHSNRWLVFACAFYFLTSFFLWRFDWRDISVVADRFLYISAFAACLGVGKGFEYYLKREGKLPQLAWVALGVVVLSFVIGSLTYSMSWRTGMDLWSTTANNSPDLAFAYNNRGSLLADQGDKIAAAKDFQRAIAIAAKDRVIKDGRPMLPQKSASQFASSHFHLGLLLAKDKRYKDALKHFDLAIYYDPEQAEYYNNRAVTYVKLNQVGNAFADYNAALAINPDFYEARVNRGLYYYKHADKDHALEDFLVATKIDPTLSTAFLQTGRIYFERSEVDKALEMFKSASKADHDDAQALFNIGLCYLKKNDKYQAQQYFSQAQLKWVKDPKKYPLPGLSEKDVDYWSKRVGK